MFRLRRQSLLRSNAVLTQRVAAVVPKENSNAHQKLRSLLPADLGLCRV